MKPKPLKGFEVLLIVLSIEASLILFAYLLSGSDSKGEIKTYGNYDAWVYEDEYYLPPEEVENLD